MTTSALVSIIIPAYNAAAYIRRCVDSILSQSKEDWELIIVNDGSTDGTEHICHDYTLKDKRVSLFSIPNGGVSLARNFGIQKARGEWLLFVDADDWLDHDVVKTLLTLQQESGCETVVYSFVFEGPNRQVGMAGNRRFSVKDIIEDNNNGANPDMLLCSPCNKLYKRDVIVSNGIQFAPDMKYGEDFVFNCQYFSYIPTAIATSDIFYHYDCSVLESGVKRVYPDYNRFITKMDSSLLSLSKALHCKQDSFETFRLVFIAQRWHYAFYVLINSKLRSKEKARLLLLWLRTAPYEILEYWVRNKTDLSSFSTLVLSDADNIDRLFVKEMNRLTERNEMKKFINSIKCGIKRIMGLC